MTNKSNSDHVFIQGVGTNKNFNICQDYAYSGFIDDLPYAILSDGCSSSKDTDFGARFLVHSAINCIKSRLFKSCNLEVSNKFMKVIYPSDLVFYKDLFSHLSSESLDATLLFVRQINEKQFYYFCIGDGCLVGIKKDNSLDVAIIEYPSGAPFYPSYYLDSNREISYGQFFSFNRKITKYNLSAGGAIQNYCIEETNDNSIYGVMGNFQELNYEAFGVISDGASHFFKTIVTETSKFNQEVDINYVLKKVLSFDNYKNNFVQRRMKKINKEIARENVFPDDDFSMAVIYFGE